MSDDLERSVNGLPFEPVTIQEPVAFGARDACGVGNTCVYKVTATVRWYPFSEEPDPFDWGSVTVLCDPVCRQVP